MVRLFQQSFAFIQQHKTAFSIAILLVFALLAFLATRIQFNDDVTQLIPKNQQNETLQKVLAQVPINDKIVVNIASEKGANSEELIAYATQFTDSITEHFSEEISHVQGKFEEENLFETMDYVRNHLPIFLEDENYKTIEAKISEDSVSQTVVRHYQTLISPGGMIQKEQILSDPLGLSFLALKNLKQLGFDENFKLKNGFLITQDEQNILLFLTPNFDTKNSEKSNQLIERLYSLQNNLNNAFSTKISSEYYGALLIANANERQIKKDISFTVAIAFTVLIVVFMLFYRQVSIPLILFFPTVFGAVLAIAFLALLKTEISAISLGIGSVLLGVTVDYSLHILTHLRNGITPKMLHSVIAKPILMSSLTTALAFLCLLFVDSPALNDLGIFAAVSVLGASVFALFFIPHVYRNKNANLNKTTVLDKLGQYKFHNKIPLVIGVFVLLIVSVFTFSKTEFNNDLQQLNFQTDALIEAKKNLEEVTDVASKSVYIATFGNDLQTVLQQNDSVFEKLKRLESDKQIGAFNSLAGLLPSEKKQLQKIATWSKFWSEEKVEKTERNFIEAGNTVGFKPTTFEGFFSLLRKDFQNIKISDLASIKAISVDDYLSEKNDFLVLTSSVKLNKNGTQVLKNAFRENDSVVLIDRKELNETLLGNLQSEFNRLIWYCLGIVLVLLFLFYKNISLTLITAAPVLLTWLLTLGIMGIFGLQFNIFNIIISSFIFGLGVDYSIFITNGLLQSKSKNQMVLATNKTAILLSVLTTLLGIGVLIFAEHPALHSLAVVSIIAILSAALLSFVLQPWLFMLRFGRNT